jgi:integrase/recombinase XerC
VTTLAEVRPKVPKATDPAIDAYIAAMRADGWKAQTLTMHRRILSRLAAWSQHRPLFGLQQCDLARWQTDRQGTAQPSVVASERSIIAGFYVWAAVQGLVHGSPAVGLPPLPPSERQQPRDFEAERAVVLYLQHLRARDLRPTTIYLRGRYLRWFARWAGGPILRLDESTLIRFQAERAKQISRAAQGTELKNIREFYRWATREGLIKRDPTIRLILPRARRGIPRPITESDLATALAGADKRMAAILGLAAFAGLRAMEIAQLEWADVTHANDGQALLRVNDGKGGHGRLIPMAPVLTDLLHALPGRRGPVIVRTDGNAAGYLPGMISQRANEYLHSLGIEATIHMCRHRFGTVAYQACQDLRATQELLGHASPMTTAVYAAAASAVVRDAVLQASKVGGAR